MSDFLRDLAMQMAAVNASDKPTSEQMRLANAIFQENTQDPLLPFATVDVQYQTFLEQLGPQREKDIVLVAAEFHAAWKELHIGMQVLKETPSESMKMRVRNVYGAIKRLDMAHLLTSGLEWRIIEWLSGENLGPDPRRRLLRKTPKNQRAVASKRTTRLVPDFIFDTLPSPFP